MAYGRCSSWCASAPYKLSITGQARAAASRNGKGDGFVTMVNAPTRIVSRPASARTRSRLSIAFATAFARRHSRARLSARAWSRARLCPWSAAVPARLSSDSHQQVLDIAEHPAAGEDRERPRPVEDDGLQPAGQIRLQLRH